MILIQSIFIFEQKKDEYFALALCIVLAIRGSYALIDQTYWNDRKRQIYFGSFFGVFGANPFHVEMLCVVWALNCINIQMTSLFLRLKHLKWLNILMALEDRISPKNIGIKPDEWKKLKIKINIMSHFNRNTTIWLSSIAGIFIGWQFYKKYSTYDFIVFGLIWILFYVITTLLVTTTIYYTNFYIFLIADLMRTKFARFEKMVNIFVELSTNDKFNHHILMEKNMTISFRYMNFLMKEYDAYNKSWKWLVTFSLVWRFVIINFVAFIAIFFDMPPTFKLVYRSIFLSENFSLFSILFQVGFIHIGMHKSANRLRQVNHCCFRRFHSLSFQMKVSDRFDFSFFFLSMMIMNIFSKCCRYEDFLANPYKFGQLTATGHLIQLKHIFIVGIK